VPADKLEKVMDAARMASSAHNAQDWKFIIVKDDEKRKELAEAARNQSFVAEAPVVIAAVALNPKRIMSCEVPQYAVNLAIACDHITLQAAKLGLGTCWIGAFSQQKVKDILKVPDNHKVVALLPLGFPKEESATDKNRKDIEDIICYDKFS